MTDAPVTPSQRELLARVGRAFQIPGELQEACGLPGGHIHDTFAATYLHAGIAVRVVHQRLNTRVFQDPVGLMRNVVRVTDHVRRRLAREGATDISRRVLQVVPTPDGDSCHIDAEQRYWRTFIRIDGVHTPGAAQDPGQAFQAGKAFGEFQNLLADFDPADLVTTIPDFHHTPKRCARLEAAIARNSHGRAAKAATEIAESRRLAPLADRLLVAEALGEARVRVTHNDTKFSNVLLDDRTGEAVCVVDLDTVMPGLVLYDFGDMMRTTTCRAAEDETDLDRVQVDAHLFEGLIQGYLNATRSFLSPGEKSRLVLAGKVITYTMAVRFLTDYLEGDPYYRVSREPHNLDRCRTQFRLIASIEAQEAALQRCVESA